MNRERVLRAGVAAGAVALPAILLLSSLRTFRSIEEQRTTYLRSQIAQIAARLETPAAIDSVVEQEPGLVDLQFFERANSGPEMAAMWEGRELYRTARATAGGVPVFRAWVPVHTPEGMRIARIDLASASADFLLDHARHNVMVASFAGVVLVTLSLYVLWAARRQMRLQHLAQLGEMSAVLAHEIRNPLGTIKGFAQLLQEQTGEKELIAPILSETTRLENLVRDLLLYGRPPQVRARATAWSEIAAMVEAHARSLIGSAPVKFEAERSEAVFQTDPALLEQALLNVVRNAIESIPAGEPGEVRLSIQKANGLTIAVSDTGSGISAEARKRLFEAFHTTKATGTGLGLPVTRKLVESLGGQVEIGANTPKGTVVELHFPRARVE